MNSVGDFLAVARVAWTVYSGYKDAPGDFKNLSDEIKSLHNIVSSDILTAKFRDPNLASEDQERLREILQGCSNVLKDLDNLLTKYKRLGSPQGSSLRALDRARWSQVDIVELRARLTSNTTLLNTFVASCSHEQIMNSQAEMQRAMGEIQTTLRRGLRRKNSTSSLHSITSVAVSINSKEAWKELRRDLYKSGVTAGMIRERKDQIVDFFQGLSRSVAVEEIPESEATGTTGVNESDDSAKVENKKRNISLKINWVPLKTLTGPLLMAAVKSGDTNAVRSRLAVGVSLEYKDINGCTALYWAAAKGHKEVVQLLLEKNANTEAARNTGETALYASAYNGHLEVVKLLLDKGANTEATRYTGATALYISARNGHLEVVKLLLDNGANTEAARDTGETALYTSAQNGHSEIVKLLLDKGANPEAAWDTGATALYTSAYIGHLEIGKLLLQKGSLLETRTNKSETALDAAVKNGHKAVAKLLTSSLKSAK